MLPLSTIPSIFSELIVPPLQMIGTPGVSEVASVTTRQLEIPAEVVSTNLVFSNV